MKPTAFLIAGLLAPLVLIHLSGRATAEDQTAQALVSFASPTALSFPLATDGLAVAPVRFPFVAFSGKDPARIAAAVVSVTRDGGTANLPSFTAVVVGPSAGQPFYSVEVDVVDDKVIAAGKYDVAVYLWQKPVKGAGAQTGTGAVPTPHGQAAPTTQTNSTTPAVAIPTATPGVDCDGCQKQAFSITREAVTLELEGSSLLLPFLCPNWFPVLCPAEASANLLETGNKSAGDLSLQSVSAKLGDSGPVRTVAATLKGDTIARGGAQTILLGGATSLPVGTWTATLRVRSDQLGATGEITKTLTIVRKIASWVLLLAILAGIFTGWFVRVRLAQRVERAAANVVAEALAVRLRELGGTIRDESFDEKRVRALNEIEKAIGGEKSPDETRQLAEQLDAALQVDLSNYMAREQAERHKLTALRDAIEGLVVRVPDLSGPLTPLSDQIASRMALVEDTRVSASEAMGPNDDNLGLQGGAGVLAWATGVQKGLEAIGEAWPQPASVPGALQPVRTRAAELAAKNPTTWEAWAQTLTDASTLAERIKADLSAVWCPAIQRNVAVIAARAIGDSERATLVVSTAALVREVEAARASGRISAELEAATMAPPSPATAALNSENLEEPGAAAMALGDLEDRTPSPTPQPDAAWSIGGPNRVRAGTARTWQLQSAAPLRGNWFVDGKIVAVDRRSLTYRLEKAGDIEISVQVGHDRVSGTLKVAVTEGAFRPSVADWRKRSDHLDRLRMGISAVLITLAGFSILQSTFANWGDVFAGFFWGFSANITVEGLLALRGQLKFPGA